MLKPIPPALLLLLACATAPHPPAAPRSGPPGTALVPAGRFVRGTSDARLGRELALALASSGGKADDWRRRLAHEQPASEVELSAFWIDLNEVTNREYQRCVADRGCPVIDHQRCDALDLVPGGLSPDHVLFAPDHPVVCVNHEQATRYCKWAGKKLPTEAQWERAAKGDGDPLFPWGDEWNPRALNWNDDGKIDGYELTAPIASFPRGASREGIQDLAGNVWEWTADWYDAQAYRSGATRDPTGPESGDRRVTRGGGFAANPIAFTTTHRAPQPPTRSAINIGFRCAAVSAPASPASAASRAR
jgi:formylglycine-generating enzyme required for sulfatase activity